MNEDIVDEIENIYEKNPPKKVARKQIGTTLKDKMPCY